VKVSKTVSQGLLVKRIQPTYPAQAKQHGLEGQVELQASITKEGNVSKLTVLAGNTTLAEAAIDAVRQWKYKPYLLNGRPTDIETQITVNFKLP
jgi:protein TonB